MVETSKRWTSLTFNLFIMKLFSLEVWYRYTSHGEQEKDFYITSVYANSFEEAVEDLKSKDYRIFKVYSKDCEREQELAAIGKLPFEEYAKEFIRIQKRYGINARITC